jgi:hypothetical protein
MTSLLRAKPIDTTVVTVLGMHRSGTSWLTGSLEQFGLELGEVNTASKGNAKGNRESRSLGRLHESVLRANGGNWRRPNYPNRWPRKARSELRRYIENMSRTNARWGFKDPRTLLLIDQWRSQVTKLVRVGIYRHPVSVYASLKKRHDDFTTDEAFELWRIYNERLLAEFEREPFPIVRFDVETQMLHENLKRVAASLDLDTARGTDFFEEALVHNAERSEIPDGLTAVWNALNSANEATAGS